MFTFRKVVGSIDQMDVDDTANTNSGSATDSKNNAVANDSNKGKGKCKLYVGSQSLGFRRDHMEVSNWLIIVRSNWLAVVKFKYFGF